MYYDINLIFEAVEIPLKFLSQHVDKKSTVLTRIHTLI